jgi:hypothetical protein
MPAAKRYQGVTVPPSRGDAYRRLFSSIWRETVMESAVFVVLEAHAHCATLYLRGSVQPAALERAVMLCGALPPAVRALRIDARDLPVHDVLTHGTIAGIVSAWRSMRIDDALPTPAVTISLQDRGPRETRLGEVPVATDGASAALA